MLPPRHCFVNWSSQLEALIVRERLSSFDPCNYLLPLIQKGNKLISKDETRDDNNNRRVTPTVKCEPNHIKHCEINPKRRTEHRFCIFKQLPFHFAPQQIRG